MLHKVHLSGHTNSHKFSGLVLKFREVGDTNLPAHIAAADTPPTVPPSALVCLKPAVVLLLLEGKHSAVNVYHLVQMAYKVFIADGAGAMWSVGEVVLAASKLFGSVLPAGPALLFGSRSKRVISQVRSGNISW